MDELDFQKEIDNLQGQIHNLRGQVDVLNGIVHILSARDRVNPGESLIDKHIADVLSQSPKDRLEKNDFERGQQDMCNKFMQP